MSKTHVKLLIICYHFLNETCNGDHELSHFSRYVQQECYVNPCKQALEQEGIKLSAEVLAIANGKKCSDVFPPKMN